MKSSNTSLVLRVCRADGTSQGGFQWPLEVGAEVVAPDWKNTTACGNGLHGWLYGQGDHSCVSYWADDAAKWLVLEVESAGIVMLDGKCKFERCIVRFVGNRTAAAAYVIEHEPQSSNVAVIGASLRVGAKQSGLVGALGTLTGGDHSTLTGGEYSTLTGGEYSTLIGGYGSTLTGGEYSTLIGGYGSTLTGGDHSTMTGGDYSTLTGGYGSTLTGGDHSTMTGGHRSTLTGGDHSTMTGGHRSTLTGGDHSTMTGGHRSTLTGGDHSTMTGGDGSILTGGDHSTMTGGDGSILTGGDHSTMTGGDGSILIGGHRSELRIRYWDSAADRYRTAIAYVGEDGIKPNTAYKLDDNHQFMEVSK